MKTKAQEKLIACQLRSEGKTVNEIAKELKVSKSSVSVWVRNVIMTPEQIERIKSISPRFPRLCAQKNKENALKNRIEYQEKGRIKSQCASSLFIMGCMLYWGEGSKNRNTVKMSNADPELMKVFIRFLREEFQVTDENITIRISAYSNNGLSCEEIQSYWLKILNLPVTCMRQLIIDRYATENAMKNKKKGKLPYGTCEIAVGNTRIVQEIFGAIQEFGQFQRNAWAE